MRFRVLLGLVLAIAMGASSAAEEAPGKSEFVRYCSACHGMAGDGTGPVAASLKEQPADLRTIAARRDGVFPEAAILRIIDGRDPVVAHGLREMPVWGEELAREVESGPGADAMARGRALLLVRYLKSIQLAEAAAGAGTEE